jgi:hypothetical protein
MIWTYLNFNVPQVIDLFAVIAIVQLALTIALLCRRAVPAPPHPSAAPLRYRTK